MERNNNRLRILILFVLQLLVDQSCSKSPIVINLLKEKKSSKRNGVGRFNQTYVNDNLTYIYTAMDSEPLILQDSNIVVDVTNNNELSYTGPVFVGSIQNSGNVIYDTGSGTFTISTSNCYNCYQNVYYPSYSSTSLKVSSSTSTIKYGSATLTGYYYQDTVCLSQNSDCAQNLKFLGITSESGLDEEDGILGLSPEYNNSESMIYSLYTQGVIDAPIFGFLITNTTSPVQSQIMLGGYDSSFIADSLNWIPLVSTNWWNVGLSEASYGGSSFIVSGKSAIIDSGTSLILMPMADLNALANLLKEDTKHLVCQSGLCYSTSSCSKIQKHAQPVVFSFGTSASFRVDPETYLIDGSELGVSGVCYFGFQGSYIDNLYVMGDVFLRAYYSVYDQQNLQVGLAASVYSPQNGLFLHISFLVYSMLLGYIFLL